MSRIFLVRSERDPGVYNILGVFTTDDEAYLFAHSHRSAAPINIVELVYDSATGEVSQTRIEYL
jgi:hypothetical protein